MLIKNFKFVSGNPKFLMIASADCMDLKLRDIFIFNFKSSYISSVIGSFFNIPSCRYFICIPLIQDRIKNRLFG